MVICTKCKENLDEGNFYIRKSGALQSWCKTCLRKSKTAETRLIYRNKDREHYRKLKQTSRHRNKENLLVKNARKRAKQFNLEFDLVKDDIFIPSICPVLGINIISDSENKDNRPTLDRKDNNRGYIKGNVFVISHRANRLKRDGSKEEINKMADGYRNLIKDKSKKDVTILFDSHQIKLEEYEDMHQNHIFSNESLDSDVTIPPDVNKLIQLEI